MDNIFIITPTREVNEDFYAKVVNYVAALAAQGYDIYFPPFDTNQVDETGLQICEDNLEAIVNADKVIMAWDGRSQGCLFDLGMAFALGKRIIPMPGCFPEETSGKSFQSMVRYLDLMEIVDDDH